MEDRTRTRKLPDGSTLRVNFTGEQKPAKKPRARKWEVVKLDKLKDSTESVRVLETKEDAQATAERLQDALGEQDRYVYKARAYRKGK